MDPIDRQAAINLLKKWSDGYSYIEIETKSAIKEFQSLPPAEPKWHDCDPTDKNTLPEPGSWAIWCDKEDHKIIARWKEDAIDHFWPDQRMFDFDLEDAVAWTEIPKRTKSPSTESETCAYWDRESNICALHRPSAQPEIIHCKDCRYREHDERYGYMCSLDTGDPYELGRCAEDENWYCADAKRRENDT